MGTQRDFLEEHRSQKYPTIFFIQRTANFRAQMELAVRLVRAAFSERVFLRGRTLLIIGGGVSGLAAGLEAAKRGMLVTLFESQKTLLSVQLPCKTRHLHPYEYDWPLARYTNRTFPATPSDRRYCPPQMRWTAGIASDVAKKMADQIEAEAPSTLGLNVGVNHIPVSLETLRENFNPRDEYAFVLVCAGGREQRELQDFASFLYWESDPLEGLCRRPRRGKLPLRILVSGGADGGLQDLLRISARPPKGKRFAAGQLLKALLPALRHCPEFAAWLRSKQSESRPYRRPDAKELWDELQALLNQLQAPRCWKVLDRAVRKSLHPAVLNGKVQIQLAFRNQYFSEAFTLNAFLVHLLHRIVKEQTWLRPEWEVDIVRSALKAHRCSRKPKECFAQPHQVHWKADDHGLREPETFDVIVLRHGSKPNLEIEPKK